MGCESTHFFSVPSWFNPPKLSGWIKSSIENGRTDSLDSVTVEVPYRSSLAAFRPFPPENVAEMRQRGTFKLFKQLLALAYDNRVRPPCRTPNQPQAKERWTTVFVAPGLRFVPDLISAILREPAGMSCWL